MDIFKNVVFIESGDNKNKLTPEEKTRLGKNLNKMYSQNKKIQSVCDGISIHIVDKSRYEEIKKSIYGEGGKWFGKNAFECKSLKIYAITDKSNKEIAYYLYVPDNTDLNESYYDFTDNDIGDYITAYFEYNIGIKVYTSSKYFK